MTVMDYVTIGPVERNVRWAEMSEEMKKLMVETARLLVAMSMCGRNRISLYHVRLGAGPITIPKHIIMQVIQEEIDNGNLTEDGPDHWRVTRGFSREANGLPREEKAA